MPLSHHFLNWDEPVLKCAVDFLVRSRSSTGFDLSDTLAVVPTRESGRRLRQALAAAAAEQGTGALPPIVVTPERLFAPRDSDGTVTSRIDCLCAFTAALRDAGPQSFPHLFPALPPDTERTFRWLLELARQIVHLRDLLAENGLTCADAAQYLAEHLPELQNGYELERWDELGRLECLAQEYLLAAGRRDPTLVKRDAAQSPVCPAHVRNVVVLAVPDPVPLAVTALEKLAERLPVHICIHAPEERSAGFDRWGRPVSSYWKEASVDIDPDAILLAGGPGEQAAHVVELMDTGLPPRDIAVSVPDAEVVPFLQRKLEGRGISSFDPAGKALNGHMLYRIVASLVALQETGSYDAFSTLLRIPDVLDWLATIPGAKDVSAQVILTQLDSVQNNHLPATLDDIRRHLAAHPDEAPALRQAADAVVEMLDMLATACHSDAVMDVMATISSSRQLTTMSPVDREYLQAAETLTGQLQLLDTGLATDVATVAADWLALAMESLEHARYYPGANQSEADIDLSGWLELHWNDAPHAVLTSMNEGIVPGAVVGHPFLPDRAREVLGLSHNDQRFARDVYLLSAIASSRAEADHVLRILVGKTNLDGDVRKPSRLLFLCPDDQLAPRARELFGEVADARTGLTWHRDWKLKPPLLPPPEAVGVTSLRDYLQCPFRFYLKHVVRMKDTDDRQSEMEAVDFGTICHLALKAFGENATLREEEDARRIAEFLTSRAEQLVRNRYGPSLSTAVLLQLDSIRQRLRAAARVQAALRQEGWHIVENEYKLGGIRGVWRHGIRIRGTIDRIDRHDDGRWRILDYKTSDQAVDSPDRSHVKRMRSTSQAPEVAVFSYRGKEYRWTDLQLPLYAVLAADRFGQLPECGYFNLPKAVTSTGVSIWPQFDAELAREADACCRRLVENIRNGVFWPPVERVPYEDAFGRLFHNGVADSVLPPFVDCRSKKGE